ncbi:tRNA (cytosine(38)-C(5))-methyltransferase [Oryzias melastigma]|nr:tRNA (cytosine(38)-C(5))-methyltransferase isoform X2 [Oryzias melastigma]XP_024117518.1 tRNA (cytosine(38)-C(5))-methyltransferase isoform X2 [Oryzias melastigma]XP_036073375.1 tRNA (cytosine(38)-C(5))-methyltransferase isoform X2 [Oryzias melastigma]KAF6722139.1 tRNA (cytosine(38)-C(5))-methyltransferase [Oryzias melastigma]
MANQIYKHNFPDTRLWNKSIEGLTLEDFDALSVDMVMMSPPCQPFTRIGLQGDVSDPRTKSFLHILHLLPRLHRLPRFILLENVKGFETSTARDRLIDTLTECGYFFQEIMASPTSVGIPNSRLRYFLIAHHSTENLRTDSKVWGVSTHPAEDDSASESNAACPRTTGPEEKGSRGPVLYKLETEMQLQRKATQDNNPDVRQIRDFLEPDSQVNVEEYLLLPKTLLRYSLLLDIVQPTSRRSVCFTKGYGRYVEGTGSVLQSCVDSEVQSVFTELELLSEEDRLQQLMSLRLRYFTPREVANLMCFPPCFSFPEHISTIQRYRVLGNSLNVQLVAKLVRLLFSTQPTSSCVNSSSTAPQAPEPGPVSPEETPAYQKERDIL